MSAIANWLLGLAQSAANMRGSKQRIRIRDNNIETYFSPEDSKKEVWENHYPQTAFYFGDSAVPVKFEANGERIKDNQVLDVQEHAVSTEYYKTVMNIKSLQKMFNVKGAKRDTMIKIMYAIGAGVAIILIMQLAMYGGGF